MMGSACKPGGRQNEKLSKRPAGGGGSVFQVGRAATKSQNRLRRRRRRETLQISLVTKLLAKDFSDVLTHGDAFLRGRHPNFLFEFWVDASRQPFGVFLSHRSTMWYNAYECKCCVASQTQVNLNPIINYGRFAQEMNRIAALVAKVNIIMPEALQQSQVDE